MKQILCLVVLLSLLAGCAASKNRWTEQFDQGVPETATIAYVPLDNRPVNTVRVEYLAQSAGFRLLMPEESSYRTALDSQPLNPNGTQYGDGAALLNWLEKTDADYYVISMDQILSGGLVNSRRMTEITDEQQRIDRLLALLAKKQVILFDTVMRLAPTPGYNGCTLTEYEALRQYGKQPRPSFSGKLTADQVITGYSVPTDLDDAVISSYLAARSRKLMLSAYLLSAVSHKDNILVYYGIDDSSPEKTIQTNEITFIEQQLENGSIFAGTDEMGLLAVTRTIRNHYKSSELPRVGIRYFGANPDTPADAYDVGSLKSNIEAHLEALGIEADASNCDLELLVFGGDIPTEILEHYRNNSKRGLPTIIVDFGENFTLPRAMLAAGDMDTSCLFGYSSWNTAGNSIGIALSNGISRYLYLKNAYSPVAGANTGFLKGLAFSFAKDVSYASVQPSVHVSDATQALHLVQQGSDLCFDKFASMLSGNRLLVSLSPQKTERIPSLSVTGLLFPWNRTFEACLEIQIE